MSDLVGKKQDDGLKALLASIHVVAQEEIVALLQNMTRAQAKGARQRPNKGHSTSFKNFKTKATKGLEGSRRTQKGEASRDIAHAHLHL